MFFKIVLPALIFSSTNFAQEVPKKFFPTQLDFSIPASPALTVLGIDASKAVSPANGQEAVLGIVNSFDEAGKLKQGFQITSTVAKLGIGPRFATGGTKFFKDPGIRMQWATNISIAATRGASDEEPSARAAIGVSLPIINDTDWRGNDDYIKQYSELLATTLFKDIEKYDPPLRTRDEVEVKALSDRRGYFQTLRDAQKGDPAQDPILTLDKLLAAYDKLLAAITNDDYHKAMRNALEEVFGLNLDPKSDYEDKLKEFVEKVEKESWNRKKVVISFAHSFFAEDAATDSLKSDGTYMWLNYSDALGMNAQYTIFGRYANKDRSYDTETSTWLVGNSSQIAMRLRGGSARSGFFLEYATKEIKNGSEVTRQSLWQGGYEASVGSGQWLQIALGKGNGKGITKNLMGILFTVNLSKDRELKPYGAAK